MGGNGSGRSEIPVDMEVVMDLLERGEKPPAIAEELGISVNTLRSRIRDIQEKQGVLLQYRALQTLHLTELQARILEAITPAKIEEAPLRDLVACYKILKDKELVVEGKPSEIKGLVAHLLHMEKMEQALESNQPTTSLIEDANYTDTCDETPELPDGKFSSLEAVDKTLRM